MKRRQGWLASFMEDARDTLPGLAETGGEVAVKALTPQGTDPLFADELAFVGGQAARYIAAKGVQYLDYHKQFVLRVAKAPEPSMTPIYFVYGLPIEHGVPEAKHLVVAPRVFFSGRAADFYASTMAMYDMRYGGAAVNIDSMEASDPGAPVDPVTRRAWNQWIADKASNPRGDEDVFKKVVCGRYHLAEYPPGKFIAWAPVVTPMGPRVGMLTENHPCSEEDPPMVFNTDREALEEFARRKLEAPVGPDYLPMAAASELSTNKDGQVERSVRKPFVWPGEPVTIQFSRRMPPLEDRRVLKPKWYVSRDDHNNKVYAWQKTPLGQVSFAKIQQEDGKWQTATWPNVQACLQHMGALGMVAVEHPTLAATPEGLSKEAPVAVAGLEI